MMDDFFARAFLAGIGVAIAAGPLGCFVVWRRMAYFGAALSHAALLGVVLGILLGIGPSIGIFAVCVAVALLLVTLEGQQLLARDTLLGIIAHGALAVGLVAVAFMQTLRIDLMGYLFGDILAVGMVDLALIAVMMFVCLGVLIYYWRPLLSATVLEELAAVEGIPVARMRLVLTLLLAVVIAVGMKVVGILLIVSMLIVPAAAARCFTSTPEQMAGAAGGVGIAAVAGGLLASLQWDVPAGPAVVVTAVAVFAVATLLSGVRFSRSR